MKKIDIFGEIMADNLSTSKTVLSLVFLAVSIYSAVNNQPELEAMVLIWLPYMSNGLVAVSLWYLIISAIHRLYPNSNSKASGGIATAVMAKANETVRTKDVIWECSVHEAGHLMTLKLLPTELLPDTLYVIIKHKLSQLNGSGGYVRYSYASGEEPEELVFTYWLLCCYRAGLMAEEIILGKKLGRSSDDLIKWEQQAHK